MAADALSRPGGGVMADASRLTSGDLTHRMTVQAPAGVLHESDPVDIATSVPMKVEPLEPQFQPRERLQSGGRSTETLYTATCRYREDIRASFVLIEECHLRKRYEVLSVIPKVNDHRLDITCVTNG